MRKIFINYKKINLILYKLLIGFFVTFLIVLVHLNIEFKIYDSLILTIIENNMIPKTVGILGAIIWGYGLIVFDVSRNKPKQYIYHTHNFMILYFAFIIGITPSLLFIFLESLGIEKDFIFLFFSNNISNSIILLSTFIIIYIILFISSILYFKYDLKKTENYNKVFYF